MRSFILTAGLLLSFSLLYAQNYEPTPPKPKADTPITTPVPLFDTIEIRQNISSGIDSYMRLQEEQNKKRKRAAMVRIGIGAALLAVLVAGLLRKKKK